MKDKNVLIVGASSGIGKKIAEYLHKQGANVILVARNEKQLNKIVSKLGNKAYVYPYDLMNLENISSIFEFCKNNNIKLDGMVYAAGINKDIPIRTNDINSMREVMRINYEAFVETAKYFGKRKYSNDSASIIAISDIAARNCSKGMAVYSASKAAMNAIVKVMSKEYINRKIRVNAILPNFVENEMVDEAIKNGVHVLERASETLGIIEPIQIAYLSEFLLCEKSKYTTGALIEVSSGS